MVLPRRRGHASPARRAHRHTLRATSARPAAAVWWGARTRAGGASRVRIRTAAAAAAVASRDAAAAAADARRGASARVVAAAAVRERAGRAAAAGDVCFTWCANYGRRKTRARRHRVVRITQAGGGAAAAAAAGGTPRERRCEE